jgi:hypothetical protein
VQEQMLDARSLQFALMFPQFGHDCGLVHGAILLYILAPQAAPELSGIIDGAQQDIGA